MGVQERARLTLRVSAEVALSVDDGHCVPGNLWESNSWVKRLRAFSCLLSSLVHAAFV